MAKMKIPIDAKVLFQMYEYAAYAKKHFKSEIAGWGHYNAENGIYKLAPLIKQTVQAADVDTFPNDILNDTKYDIRDLIVQWHSHVDMGVTPSSTDKQNIEDCLELFPMLISIIVNCKNEYSARLDFAKAGTGLIQLELDNPITIDVDLVPYYDNPKVSKEVLSKCSLPKPVTSNKVIGFQPQSNFPPGTFNPIYAQQYTPTIVHDYRNQPKQIEASENLFNDFVPPTAEIKELESPQSNIALDDEEVKFIETIRKIGKLSEFHIFENNNCWILTCTKENNNHYFVYDLYGTDLDNLYFKDGISPELLKEFCRLCEVEWKYD